VQTLPASAELNGHDVNWAIVPIWPRDITRLVANVNVPGQQPSIWTVPMIGGPPRKVRDIQDAWSQVWVDKIKIGDFLALADALKSDSTRAVMDNLASDLVKIETDMVGDNHRGQYQQRVREMFVPVGEKLGWTPAANDSEEQRALRADLLRLAGGVGHDPKLIQFSRELVQKVLNGHNADSTLLGEAMVIAARNGDAVLCEDGCFTHTGGFQVTLACLIQRVRAEP
jgi:hypothetical protein